MSAHTPGAVRASERIVKLACFPPIMVDALAAVIDHETGARELLEALKASINDDAGAHAKALIAIAKAEGKS